MAVKNIYKISFVDNSLFFLCGESVLNAFAFCRALLYRRERCKQVAVIVLPIEAERFLRE